MVKDILRVDRSVALRKDRFNRLFLLGAIAVAVPSAGESFFGTSALLLRAGILFLIGVYSVHILLGGLLQKNLRGCNYAVALTLLLASRPLIELGHDELQLTSLFGLVITTLFIWTVWSLNPMIEWFRIIALFGSFVAIASVLMSYLTPHVAFMVTELGNLQGAYKSSSGRGLLAGPFDNSNTLGIILATTLPFVFLWKTFLQRLIIIVPILVALWMTFSRTSLIAALVVLVLGIILLDKRVSQRIKGGVALASIVGIGTLQVILPFMISDPTFFTGRGSVWMADSAAWRRHPWFGNGEEWHVGQDGIQSGIIYFGQTSSHNTALGWLTFGGIVYFLCCVSVTILLIRISWSYLLTSQCVPILFVVATMIVGISESHWHVFSTSPLFFVHGFVLIGIVLSARSPSITLNRNISSSVSVRV
ncbi:O-antigen ligase family protein [Corynebacterium stationis]|uniref:O-antigen ligase family protein n=1 Tax=Corynebacterium stationis TaxID=1705 RepID=UPI00273AD6CE|nr:O-antigen ligase family protein [Corynebacterium stationis]WLP87113.1 O-antigen ligase family protein [Corynebacterium stationis]